MKQPFALFEVFGIELEYMIVDSRSLSVAAICDRLLEKVAGRIVSDIQRGIIGWSNELALHVVEIKTDEPVATLEGLADKFQSEVRFINQTLSDFDARLMPTAMHPWMNPDVESRLWPHECNEVYESFNRIFDCRGHGWSNLQSVHINLPFADDSEFGRLHAAVRLILPLLPAIAASSPVVDGQLTGFHDNRLEFYRNNCRRIPSLTGHVIPEPVYSRADYQREVFDRIYRDIEPHDTAGIMKNEWLNARGAIARFDRGAIEIRVLDIQECPAADLAISQAIVAALRQLVAESWTGLAEQQSLPVEPLAKILLDAIRSGENAVIDDPAYLRQWGMPEEPCTAHELWNSLAERVSGMPRELHSILQHGTLATRIERAVGREGRSVREVYSELCDCLAEGRSFV